MDLLHALIALADAGESVLPWLERFDAEAHGDSRWAYALCVNCGRDWVAAIDKVVAVIEGAPLLQFSSPPPRAGEG